MNSIIIGIISGLVTTFLVVTFKFLWDKAINPWYERRIYKDIDISGQWIGRYKNDSYGKELFNITQYAHHIEGNIVTIDGKDKGNIYNFHGVFKNLILTLSYSSANPKNIDRGTLTLKTENNGSKLIGYCSLYDDDNHNIESIEYNLKRKDKA